MAIDLSIIIVNYNTADCLGHCLSALFGSPPAGAWEVVVVDNASSDQSVPGLRRDFPQVRLLVNDRNLGFGAAGNRGFAQAKGELILFMNADVVVHPRAIDWLVKTLRSRPEVGVCGGKLVSPDGTVQPTFRRFPTHRSILFARGSLLGKIFPDRRGRYLLPEVNEITPVDSVAGAFLLVRRRVYEEVKGFDEQFFLYAEDLDFCKRVKSARSQVLYIPPALATHQWGASTVQNRPLALRAHHQSIYRYFRKHHPQKKVANLFLYLLLRVHLLLLLAANFWRDEGTPERNPAGEPAAVPAGRIHSETAAAVSSTGLSC
jgi:hypothetical protein